jgi:hypothetical protein
LSYEVDVDNQSNFSSPEFSDHVVPASQLSVTMNHPLGSGTYYWRVRAKIGASSWSAWSTGETFIVNAP